MAKCNEKLQSTDMDTQLSEYSTQTLILDFGFTHQTFVENTFI